MSSKVYPIDISGIKSIGTEEWMKNYYIPVTGKKFQTIYDNVSTSFLDVLLKQNNNEVVYWIAISNMTVINYTSQWISEVSRLIRLKGRGYEFIIGKEKARIPNDISMYEYDSLAKINLIGKVVSGLNYQERIKNVLSTIKYNIFPPVFADRNFLANISSPAFFIGYRSQEGVVAYCNQSKIVPIHLHPLFFANNHHEEDNKYSEINEILGFVDSFISLLKKQFPGISSSLFELLRKKLNECFRYSLLLFRQNVNVFRKFKPKKLLATGLGYPVHRLFCASWRYAGGDVVGFKHGNSYSYGYYPGTIILLSLVNQYVTVTAGHKKLLQKAAEDFSCGLKMGNIIFTKQSHYERLFKEIQREKPVNKIKKIMLIGFPMSKFYYCGSPGGFAFAQLDMEIRLAKLLKKKGYNVIYKPHPMTMNEIEGIFDNYVDEIVEDKYENVYDIADCILFGDYSTSTFGFSLLTNRPIVLIDIKGCYWFPKSFELLNKRCSIVMAELDESGRIVFEENEVLNAVEESISNINYDILHEFAF